MPLVIAVEPDARQAAILQRVVRHRAEAEIVLAETKDAAIEALHARMPDLILVSALLSPRDEADLAEHLRGLDEAEHLQTLTIPLLAGSATPASGKKKRLLGKLRGRRSTGGPAVDESAGCDPAHFADEVRGYLKHAEDIRLTNEARRERERREAAAAEARAEAELRQLAPPEPAAEPPATRATDDAAPLDSGLGWAEPQPVPASTSEPAYPQPEPEPGSGAIVVPRPGATDDAAVADPAPPPASLPDLSLIRAAFSRTVETEPEAVADEPLPVEPAAEMLPPAEPEPVATLAPVPAAQPEIVEPAAESEPDPIIEIPPAAVSIADLPAAVSLEPAAVDELPSPEIAEAVVVQGAPVGEATGPIADAAEPVAVIDEPAVNPAPPATLDNEAVVEEVEELEAAPPADQELVQPAAAAVVTAEPVVDAAALVMEDPAVMDAVEAATMIEASVVTDADAAPVVDAPSTFDGGSLTAEPEVEPEPAPVAGTTVEPYLNPDGDRVAAASSSAEDPAGGEPALMEATAPPDGGSAATVAPGSSQAPGEAPAPPSWMTEALSRLRKELKQLRATHFPARPDPPAAASPPRARARTTTPPAAPAERLDAAEQLVARPAPRVETTRPDGALPQDEYGIHDGRRYGFGALMRKLEAAGVPTGPEVEEGPSAADLLLGHTTARPTADAALPSDMLDAVPAGVEARDPFRGAMPKRSGLAPLAMWARAEVVLPAAAARPEAPDDDLPALMAGLELPADVASVGYATGCRIRRVKVLGSKVRRKSRTRSLDPVVILSRRKLQELRETRDKS